MKSAYAIVLAILALALLPSVGAVVPGTPIVAGPGAWVTDYATKVASVQIGGEITLANGDIMRHDVVASDAFGDGGRPWCSLFPVGRCPIFWSPLTSLGETTTVQGTDQLAPATVYAFYCTLHPQMKGTLVALPAP